MKTKQLVIALLAVLFSSATHATEVRPVYTVGFSTTTSPAEYIIDSEILDLSGGTTWMCQFVFSTSKEPWPFSSGGCHKIPISGYAVPQGNYLAQGKSDPASTSSITANNAPAYVMVDQNTHAVIGCVIVGFSGGTCANMSLP